MVWLVEWSRGAGTAESETKVTCWSSEGDARMSACRNILSDINKNWDLDDDDQRDSAKSINNLCALGSLKEAISEYNDWNANLDDYESQRFLHVHEEKVQTFSGGLCLLHISDPDDEEDEEEDLASNHVEEEAYQASTPGATCRGPCGNYNPDAYADKRDGTHVCYQCKMMFQVFGGKVT